MGRLTTKPRVRAALARWTLVGALSASMALFGGGTLANADTTVVSTPTVVASAAAPTVAAIIATPVAVRAATVAGVRSNAIVRARGTGPSPCVTASPVEWQGSGA